MLKKNILFFSFFMMIALLLGCKGNGKKGDIEKEDVKKVTIKFDTAKVKCESQGVSSGNEVDDGAELTFTAILPYGQKVKEWKANDITIPNKNGFQLKFKVDIKKAKQEGKKKVIKISVAFENKTSTDEDAILVFDTSKIAAKRAGSAIEPNKGVNENDVIVFTTKEIKGKKFVKWSINGTPKDDQTKPSFTYTVSKSDIVNGTITIDWIAKDLKVFVIDFDEALISCKIRTEALKKGETAYEGDSLTFSAIALKNNEKVKDWIVNDTVASSTQGLTLFIYTVKESDAQNEGGKPTIKVSYTLKEMITIEYGSDIKECVIPGLFLISNDQPVPNGSKVAEKTSLRFKANLTEGEAVKEWKINDTIQTNQTKETFSYTVEKNDAKNNVIRVSVTKKSLNSATLKFDDKKVSCKNKKDYKAVQPNTTIYEGEKFKFSAILEDGKSLKNWTVNGTEKEKETKLEYDYTFNIDDATGNPKEVTIGYTENSLEEMSIEFEESKMTCSKDNKPIQNGAKVYEGDSLRFTANVEGKKIKAWLVKDVVQKGWGGYNYLRYTVKKDDCTVGTKKIKVEYKENVELKIKFNDQSMSCKKSIGSESIANDTNVLEGTALTFTAILPEGHGVETWTVNTDKKTQNGGNTFRYTVAIEDAINTNEVTVAVTTKSLDKLKIHFDKAKMTCTKNGQEIQSESDVVAGDKLKFTANVMGGSCIDAWTVKGKAQAGYKGYNYLNYTVKEEDCEDPATNKIIKVDYTLSPNRIRLIFESNVTCRYDSFATGYDKIESTAFVMPKEWVLFTATLQGQQKVISWSRNGNVIAGQTKNTYSYQINPTDAIEGSDGIKEMRITVQIQ